MQKPIIIAEIGVNYHDIAVKNNISPMQAAKLMITEAIDAGVDVVKFQSYKANMIAARNSPAYWDTTEETLTNQRELFCKYDSFGEEDYAQLKVYCQEKGVEFMSTPFDVQTAKYVNKLVERHKIASADITNTILLREIGSYKKPVILSTGASTHGEIEEAVNILMGAGAKQVTLLHCVLEYPTPIQDANLSKIIALKMDFNNAIIGYSDHTKYNLDMLVTAWMVGANVIEKHFTLDKRIPGNDHYHAADPTDIKEFLNKVEYLRTIIGCDDDPYSTINEQSARMYARRGVYLRRNVVFGQKMRSDDIIPLRPLGDGITPKELEQYVSKGAKWKISSSPGEQVFQGDCE
jgi:sialic acid synthase SpsE